MEHVIELKDLQPFREAARRYSDEKRRYIETQVREMLSIIEPSTFPYSSQVVIAARKNGEYRFCVDYRRLNNLTVDIPQCLPRIHEIIKDLGCAKVFSLLDLRNTYWQIPLSHQSKKISAFSTPGAVYFSFELCRSV